MLIEAIRDEYQRRLPDMKLPKGNPTGSRWGKCLAQSQQLQYPELSHPEPYPLRSTLNFEMGDLVEAWWHKRALELFGDRVGMSQAVFYFPAALRTAEERELLTWKLKARKVWGRLIPGFEPPYVRGVEGGRLKIRLPGWYGREDSADLKKLGFVLDPRPRAGEAPEGTLWAPAYVDWILHTDDGPAIYESKAMSDFQFRRAVVGTFGLDYRLQLAGMVKASGLDAAWALYRKGTSHIAEIYYSRKATRTEVLLTKLNGQQERWVVLDGRLRLEGSDDQAPSLSTTDFLKHRAEVLQREQVLGLGEAGWWGASVWTPYDDGVMAQIRDRILAVLLFDPGTALDAPLRWTREYGPDFRCKGCAAQGSKPCPPNQCVGGRTPKARAVHKACNGAGRTPCAKCQGTGQVETAELSYPCSYCGTVAYCWGRAGVTLELDAKPHYRIQRAAYEASGLTFTPAEPPEEELPAPADEEVATTAEGTDQAELPV